MGAADYRLVFKNAETQMLGKKGKGMERHGSTEPLHAQPSPTIARFVGLGYPIGQAVKKALEAGRLVGAARRHELLGAINYLAIAVMEHDRQDAAE